MMDSTELNTRSLSLKYVFIRLDGILLVGGRCYCFDLEQYGVFFVKCCIHGDEMNI